MANKQPKKQVAGATIQQKINVPSPVRSKTLPQSAKLALLLGILSLLLYANTLKNGFVLDDFHVIIENTIVTKGVSAIPEILATPYRRGYLITGSDLYRPLSLVMFATEYQLFGKSPAPYHSINILLFAGCVILLFFFLDDLFEHKKTEVAFIASLLFALHPIHTEVVANIKSRDELLCFFFAFLSLNVFCKYVKTGKISQLLAGCLCFFLSLLAKETVITFLAIIPFVFFFYKNNSKPASAYITAGIVLVAVLFLAVRFSVLNHYDANQPDSIKFIDNALVKPGLSAESRIATAILMMGYYLRLLLIPYPLICDYSFASIPFTHFSDPLVIASLAAYAILVVSMIKLFLRDKRDPFAFSILFFLATASLFTNVFFLLGATMGERFMFFPSVGFCLAVALLVDKLISKNDATAPLLKNNKVMAPLIVLSVGYAVVTFGRNSEWSDNYTLYSSDVKKVPDNCKLNYNLSVDLHNIAKEEKDPAKQRKAIDEAIVSLRRALAVYPDFDDAEANLAFSYFFIQQFDSSELHDKRALQINPGNDYAINDLAGAYFFRKNYPGALSLYERSISVNPGYVNSYANAGICNLYMNKYDSAVYYCNRAIAADQGFNSSYEILAATYHAMNKPDSARKYELIAQKNNPGFKL